jgi:hypothetical protein
MKHLIGKKVLVTTSAWFFAPDGREYRAAYGTLKAINTSEETLGFTPNRTHTNWFLQVGNLSIAGCQVQYLVEKDEVHLGEVYDWTPERTEKDPARSRVRDVKRVEHFYRPAKIYDAD